MKVTLVCICLCTLVAVCVAKRRQQPQKDHPPDSADPQKKFEEIMQKYEDTERYGLGSPFFPQPNEHIKWPMNRNKIKKMKKKQSPPTKQRKRRAVPSKLQRRRR